MKKINKVFLNPLDYDEYWQYRLEYQTCSLKHRDLIFMKWIKPFSKVLVLGCGYSPLMRELINQRHCQVKGVDIAKNVIEKLKKEKIACQLADISSQNYQLDNGFDYIILSEVLEHISNPETVMKKIITKSQHIIISVPNSAYIRYRLQLTLAGTFPKQWVYHPGEHLRFWSKKDFIKWLNIYNLEVIKSESANGIMILKNLWPNMFGHQICYLVKTK